MTTHIDIHVLHSVPPSCLNRDDTGSPKTGDYGDTKRARLSSQSLKAAVRRYVRDNLKMDGLGMRTLRLPEMVAEQVRANHPDRADEAQALANLVLGPSGLGLIKDKPKTAKKGADGDEPVNADATTGALTFLTVRHAAQLAQVAVEAVDGKVDKKALNAAMSSAGGAIDIALFGRMVAMDKNLNVDAACQVAHAIGVGGATPEFDFFTAVDDLAGPNESGAGMMGTIEFTSATFYKYATVNLESLAANLDGDVDAAARGTSTFLDAFVRTLPSGRQNSFAAHTLPSLVMVSVREDQPVNLVDAFESPIRPGDGGTMPAAAQALVDRARELDGMFGQQPARTWVMAGSALATIVAPFGAPSPLPTIVAELESELRERR